MPRTRTLAWGLVGIAACLLIPSAHAGKQPGQLECLERFGIKRYVIGCWSMPARERHPDEAYWRAMRDDGFNVVLGAEKGPAINRENDLEPVLGIMREHPSPKDFPLDLLHSLDLKVMLIAIFERVPQIAARHDKIGGHPALMGYQLCDNCYLHDITSDAAWWLKRTAPKTVPWVTYNPQPVTQIRAGLPIITSQNYPFLGGPPYQNGGDGPDDAARSDFAACANYDRLVANRYHGAPWPIMACDCSPSQYRFQQHACAAYGAQAIWLFGYQGYVRLALRDAIRPTHDYLKRVAGPWVLGRRSAEVLHTGPEVPSLHQGPGPGKLIERMDDHMLAGLLVPDREFNKGNIAPDCVYFVDKRTKKFAQREEIKTACGALGAEDKPLPGETLDLIRKMHAEGPEPRAARVTFSAKVRRAEAQLPDGGKQKYDLSKSREITLPPLKGGEGVLLRIESEPAKVIRLPSGTVARQLPNPWKFSFGETNEWASVALDDTKWRDMNAGFYGTWLKGPYIGVGTYRTRYVLPEDMRRKHVYLHFGAADEQAFVCVDGRQVIDHSTGAMKVSSRVNRTLPFHAECPALADGRPHTIAVRVINIHGLGGLYEPVCAVASDEPLDDDQLWMATEPIRQARVRL